MKLFFLTLALLPGALFADLRVPSSVFTMDELAEAQAKAAEDEEALIFLYTDPAST